VLLVSPRSVPAAAAVVLKAEARSQLPSEAERDRRYIVAMAERFSKGAAALKGHRWREQEAKYAQQMQKIAEDSKVSCLTTWWIYFKACIGVQEACRT